MSADIWTALGITAVVYIYNKTAVPPIYPKSAAQALDIAFGLFALALPLLTMHVSVRDVLSGQGAVSLIAGMLVLAVVSPFLGLWASHRKPDGQEVFSTGEVPGTSNRFWPHLVTNILGAAAATVTVLAVASNASLLSKWEQPRLVPMATIALNIAWIVVRAFVSSQQAARAEGRDIPFASLAHSSKSDVESAIRGDSLHHAHQAVNAVYLTLALFVAILMTFYLVQYAIIGRVDGTPVPITGWDVTTASMMVLFIAACGVAGWGTSRAVYLTFLTGMPAALVGIILWFSLYESSPLRNHATWAVVGAGYLVYSGLIVFVDWRERRKFAWHYLAATVIALVVVSSFGTIYIS